MNFSSMAGVPLSELAVSSCRVLQSFPLLPGVAQLELKRFFAVIFAKTRSESRLELTELCIRHQINSKHGMVSLLCSSYSV